VEGAFRSVGGCWIHCRRWHRFRFWKPNFVLKNIFMPVQTAIGLSADGITFGVDNKNTHTMSTLFDAATATEFINRINKLTPATQRQWGKMDVAQMMAHCTTGLEMAAGTTLYKRAFIGRILGPFFKKDMMSAKPMGKSLPTLKEMTYVDVRDFEDEKQKLIMEVRSFLRRGEKGIPEHTHPFFGPMTTHEWAYSATKHLDHHLKQFGV
jgi:uncharacterized protein DUF1569